MQTMTVMFRFPVKRLNDFTVEVQVPTGANGVPVLHEEFIRLYNLSEDEIREAQAMALRAVAIMPQYWTERAAAQLHTQVFEDQAERVAVKQSGKWTPVLVEAKDGRGD